MTEKTMLVAKIDDGTVIDKIPAGLSITLLRVLKIREDITDTVAVGIRVKSESMGTKDIVKLTNRYLTQNELKTIWLIAPDAVITIIKDYIVSEKFKIAERTDSNDFSGVLKCENPSCATNYNEPVTPKYTLMRRDPMLVRCLYCDRVMLEEGIRDQL